MPLNNPGLPEPLNVKILVDMHYRNGYSKDYEKIIENLVHYKYTKVKESNWKGLTISSGDFIRAITTGQRSDSTSQTDTEPYISEPEDNKTEDKN